MGANDARSAALHRSVEAVPSTGDGRRRIS
jgi:hypothetical protein